LPAERIPTKELAAERPGRNGKEAHPKSKLASFVFPKEESKMKKVLASLMAVGLMATAADAALIGLRWAENPAQVNEGAGTIEVYMSLTSGDVVAGVTFNYGSADPNLIATAQGTTVPNWQQTGDVADGILGNVQFAASANVGGLLAGPIADVVVGTTTVAINGPLDGTTKDIFALIPQNAVGVTGGTGSPLTWNANYASNPAYSGYIAFAPWGNPGWGTMPLLGHQPTPNPLQITKVPEPSSLALIALGGFALLRRRR
jgi:hypothetical protein